MIDPKVMGASLGADEQNQNRSGALITAVALLSASLLIMVYAAFDYAQMQPNLGFGLALLINYSIFQIFNLADLFILDWLIYMKIKPTFMRPDFLPVVDDFSKHAKASFKGIFIGILPALVSTCIWKFFF
ncbi:MAG: hypothetical protein AAF985_12610 [Bacteroidota bacterium]